MKLEQQLLLYSKGLQVDYVNLCETNLVRMYIYLDLGFWVYNFVNPKQEILVLILNFCLLNYI